MTASASKPRTSPAILLDTFSGSNDSIRPIPLRPLISPSQKEATSLPNGVTAPIPVTTTRRSPSRISLTSCGRLIARDDDAERRLHGDLAVHRCDCPHAAEHAAQLLDFDL